MLLYAISRAPELPGRTSTFHHEMFHGLSWRKGRLAARNPFGERQYLEPETQNPLLIVRNGRMIPPVTDPRPTLIVAEAVKHVLGRLPRIGFLPVAFWRLFDYPFETGNYDFEQDPRWKEYCSEICGKDYAWFFVGLPDEPDLHRTIGAYYEVLTPSPVDLEREYTEARELNMPMASGRISERMLVDNSIIHAPPGYFMNQHAFSLLSPYLDCEYFVLLEIEVDFALHPSATLKPKRIRDLSKETRA